MTPGTARILGGKACKQALAWTAGRLTGPVCSAWCAVRPRCPWRGTQALAPAAAAGTGSQ